VLNARCRTIRGFHCFSVATQEKLALKLWTIRPFLGGLSCNLSLPSFECTTSSAFGEAVGWIMERCSSTTSPFHSPVSSASKSRKSRKCLEAAGVEVFYDNFSKSQLWGEDL
jgi:hypothetical protein